MRLPPGACLSYDSGTDPRVLRLIQGVPEELWGARLALQVQLLSHLWTVQSCSCWMLFACACGQEVSHAQALVCSAVSDRNRALCVPAMAASWNVVRCTCSVLQGCSSTSQPAQEAVLQALQLLAGCRGASVKAFSCFTCPER